MNYIQYDNTVLGEPEISFYVDTNNYINLWIGSFDSLMEYGVPKHDGKWDDFLCHYHMEDGFYDNKNWHVPSSEEYLNSIKNIEVPVVDVETLSLKNKQILLFEYSLTTKTPVIINYF